jgi:tetratricopeptide (TPR) repeat protein
VGCLDETTVARFLDKSLTRDEAAIVTAHIDACDDCRRLVSALAAQPVGSIVVPAELGSFASNFEPTPVGHELDGDDPAEVGRYRVTGRIGIGAMGAVYAAHDPELAREVAIKLVRAGGESARLLREAKALAKVSHPNVVAVYDAGTVGDQVFIAMELVRSGTMRDWLATPRATREIVRVAIDVARGLAAAHAAGLVHRDVKPDNILVEADGRVRIGDFGFAAEPEGTLAGTPAYMAPEQFAGGPIDARTDQFGLCATLHEAVWDVRPFAGDDVKALAANVKANARVTPPDRRVPRWLRAAIDRGLAPAPGARFASMDALVVALSAGARRRTLARGGALLGLGAAAGIAGVIALRAPGADPCAAAGNELEAVWNPRVRVAITDAFAATGRPFAADAAKRAVARIDDYAAAWTAAARDACVRPDESALRLDCLRHRRDDLAALTRLFAAADDKLAAHAIDAVASLPAVTRCDDVAALRREQAPAADPVADARRAQLSEVVAAIAAGRRDRARVLALQLADATKTGADPELRIAALTRLAQIERSGAGTVDHARALLEEAIAGADRAGLDRLRAEAWAQLISTLTAKRDDLASARRLAPQAEAAIARLGSSVDPGLEIRWLSAQGTLLAPTDPHASVDKYRQAVARAGLALGKTSPLYVEMLEQLVGTEQMFDTPQAHLDAVSKLVELNAQLYGEHHPETAEQRQYLGEAYMHLGKSDDAIAQLRRSVEDLVAGYGEDAPEVADARTRLAGAFQMAHKLPEAIAENARALAIRRKRFAPGSAFIIESFIQRGRLEGASGKWRESIVTLTDVRKLAVDNVGAKDLLIAEIDKDLGFAYSHVDNNAEAVARYHAALALEEAALGKNSPALVGPLRQLGTILVMAHKERDAVEPLERALAMLQDGSGDPLDLADVRLELAQAIATTDKKRAVALATAARDEYAKQHIDDGLAEARQLVAKLSR